MAISNSALIKETESKLESLDDETRSLQFMSVQLQLAILKQFIALRKEVKAAKD